MLPWTELRGQRPSDNEKRLIVLAVERIAELEERQPEDVYAELCGEPLAALELQHALDARVAIEDRGASIVQGMAELRELVDAHKASQA